MADKEFVYIPGIRQEIERPEPAAEAEAPHNEHLASVSHLMVQAPPGMVLVEPGGRTFRTIKEANDSITDAGPSKPYMMNCGAGTWEEQVILRPYVNLTGTLDPQTRESSTIIRCPALKPGTPGVGTIVGASNSSITQCLINTYARESGMNGVGIACDGANPFTIGNCRLFVLNNGFEFRASAAIAIDFIESSQKGASNVRIESTHAHINVPDTANYPVALGVGGSAHVTVSQGSLIARGRDHSAGAVGFGTSTSHFSFTEVTGGSWSLSIWRREDAEMTAYHCTLNGAVDPRVKVIS